MFDYNAVSWNAIGADNFPEAPMSDYIVTERIAVQIFGLFLRRDYEKLNQILVRALRPMQVDPPDIFEMYKKQTDH